MKPRSVINVMFLMLCGMLAACAIITVNVYFPEKDVKQAYKSLDEMLLNQGGENAPDTSGADLQPPQNGKQEEPKPQSMLGGRTFSFSFVGTAHAEEPVADQLAVEIASNPEVLKAYDEMKERLPRMNALRESGAVGETKQGLVTVRDKEKAGEVKPLVDAENRNRKVVITAMAKAILKINKKPEDSAALNQVLAKAAASYASTKQEEARPGWWIELPNGRWVQK